jgi:RNA polymerase sigma-70 factor (ECF subfamily)
MLDRPGMARLEDVGDAALVLAVARYRTEGLAEAYRRHAGAIYALARRVTADSSLAEDVVQEVFLGLWRDPERFDPDRGSLRSWLLAQAHGKSVDLVRAESSRKKREEREARLRAEAGYDIEREVWDLAVAERVREAVGGLRKEERRAIQLAYFGGQTYREVARLLGEPEGTVKARIRSGLRNMRARLTNAGVHEP